MNKKQRILKFSLATLAMVLMLALLCGCGGEEATETSYADAAQLDSISEKIMEENETSDNNSGKDMVVHFIDVGQGDAILLQSPNGATMLIDGGPRSAGQKIVSYLKKAGVTSIDSVVATHPHEDHIGGLLDVFETFSVDTVYDPGYAHTTEVYYDFLTLVVDKSIKYGNPVRGDTISLDKDISVTVLHPNTLTDNINNNSIVLKVQYKAVSFLLTGDIEKEAEEQLLDSSPVSLNSTVLKVSHHGSITSTAPEMKNAVSPQYAVISVGSGNSYGHPSQSTLSTLGDTELYRTDINGTVIMRTDGNSVTVSTDKEAQEPSASVHEEGYKKPGDGYVGSKNSDKYHYPSCNSATKIKPANKVWFNTKADVESSGYVPCKECKP